MPHQHCARLFLHFPPFLSQKRENAPTQDARDHLCKSNPFAAFVLHSPPLSQDENRKHQQVSRSRQRRYARTLARDPGGIFFWDDQLSIGGDGRMEGL